MSSPFVVPATAKSWIPVSATSHFPIQNLPFGLVAVEVEEELELIPASIIGDQVILLPALVADDMISEFEWPLTPIAFRKLRRELYDLFKEDNPKLRDNAVAKEDALMPADEAQMLLPMEPTSFVDFYSGIQHASNVGKMFRPDQPPLLPNYRYLPVAYNGRAGTVLPSEFGIIRPKGIQKVGENVVYGPSKELDFELEMGFFVGKASELGTTISVDQAEDFILGVMLVNDWSARDVQRFEYQPLGPFLGKSFATTASPWLVHLDALEPFRVQQSQDPAPLPHLAQKKAGLYDITLEVQLQTPQMSAPEVISRSNSKHLYWTFAQQLAHLASNGCSVDAGDLVATGTISGETPDSYGSMLELCWKGSKALVMPETGEKRLWLEDGDTLILTGYAQGDGYRIGFGEAVGTIEPAV